MTVKNAISNSQALKRAKLIVDLETLVVDKGMGLSIAKEMPDQANGRKALKRPQRRAEESHT
jgi:uncharacterized protein YgbK (DUF1537 family)